MEMFSCSTNLCFNFDETTNGVSELLNELEKTIGNAGSSNITNKQNIFSGKKNVPLFNETELNNSLDFIENQLDFIEKHFTDVEPLCIDSFENNQEFLQSTLNLSISSDLDVNDNDIDRSDSTKSKGSFKKNVINRKNRKSRISKKDVGKDNSRRYREKEKKIQNKLEQELIKKSELNDFLRNKVNLLNNLIELFKCICSFRNN
jgi:hypothetical protein